MISTVLFDLDGTLLPMDQEVFTQAYFSRLAAKLAPHGYPAGQLIPAIWEGVKAMVQNDGSRPNEQAFWERFAAIFGEHVYGDIPIFESFYENEFNGAREVCGFEPRAAEVVDLLAKGGRQLILASNPIFPAVAQSSRMRWAGVDPALFSYITSYENSRFCKPDPAYYTEIAEKCGFDPSAALMVGNDVREDGAARRAGMQVFILTGCLIDAEGRLDDFPHGDYAELFRFLAQCGIQPR